MKSQTLGISFWSIISTYCAMLSISWNPKTSIVCGFPRFSAARATHGGAQKKSRRQCRLPKQSPATGAGQRAMTLALVYRYFNYFSNQYTCISNDGAPVCDFFIPAFPRFFTKAWLRGWSVLNFRNKNIKSNHSTGGGTQEVCENEAKYMENSERENAPHRVWRKRSP